MDTKLKKSHKLATIIIILSVIIPALVLVGLYPTIEKAMYKQYEEYEQRFRETYNPEEYEWALTNRFINCAVESNYYIFGQMLQKSNEDVDMSVLLDYGWNDDYLLVFQESEFQAVYTPEGSNTPIEIKNTESLDQGVAKLYFAYDKYGNLTEIQLDGKVNFELDYEHGISLADIAQNSAQQYSDNVQAYNAYRENKVDGEQLRPKNVEIVYVLDEHSLFIENFDEYIEWFYDNPYAISPIYLETGAIFVVIAMAFFVAVIAFVLPFFKKLNTGKEKIFKLPFEINLIVLAAGIALTVFMIESMGYVTMHEVTTSFANEGYPEFLGYKIDETMAYNFLRVISFAGWSICFFAEYIVVSVFRRLVMEPKTYLLESSLVIRFIRWMKRKVRKLYLSIINIDINKKLNGQIVKIVICNFVILSVLCCMWFFGIVGLVVYTIGLYVMLKKYSHKIQKQYQSILDAANMMAQGDLKISLEEELGIFEPIGESLEKIQQGFEKAVKEEAKSQNMKTELITNVSHDLKTPLTAIITYVDLLKKEDVSEEERKTYIQTLDQKSQRLKVLIEDLFEVSKANSGNVKMNLMQVDIVSLLKQVRSEMSEQIENSALSFRWKFPEEKEMLLLDGQRMYRVFENLLNNILKYAMPYTRVYVDVISNEKTAQIVFRNVSAMELAFEEEDLTERFVRGDVSRNSEGSGLGLAIVKSFVELQNGKFNIEMDGDLFKAIITFEK